MGTLRTSKGTGRSKLSYRIVLYAADGTIISEQTVLTKEIEIVSSGVTWVDDVTGKRQVVTGNVTVTEV